MHHCITATDHAVDSSQLKSAPVLMRWAAQYTTGLLIKLTPKGVVFSFLFSSPWLLVTIAVVTSLLACIPLLLSQSCSCGAGLARW